MSETYADADIYGRELSDGNAVQHIDAEAIKNALTLFLTSKKGDFLRNPELGGPLDRVKFKSLDGSVSSLVIFTLKNAITNYFSPAIKLRDIQFTPNYEKRIWEILIYYSSNLSNSVDSVTVYTKDILNIAQQLDQNVTWVGENLRMFCLIQKSSMGFELLKYNSNDSTWRWGKFIFVNFTTEDEYYTEILNICNS